MSDTRTLKMDKPVDHSLLDGAQGVIGLPHDRVDGPIKVAGAATYSAEYRFDGLVHGVLVQAPLGCGRVTGFDCAAARAMPGVIDVLVDLERFVRFPQHGDSTDAPTQDVRAIDYFGEPVALVVADSFERARAAAQAVIVEHEACPGRFDFEALAGETEAATSGMLDPRIEAGDIDAAMRDAAVTVDAVWTTPSQSSAAMEPHASIAEWEGDRLILHGAYQMPANDREQLAKALDMPVDKVRIVARYIGGGFGAKLGISPESVAAALAAKKLGRPVKVVMSRQQVFDATVRRSNTRQRIRLGATSEGRLTAMGHETIGSNLPAEGFCEPAGIGTMFLYAGENRRITHDLVRVNWLVSLAMRAPGEAVGMLALECAMDELAERLDMDPVALRKLNDPECDPGEGIPFSSRSLGACLDDAASAFGWESRNRTPGALRDGEWLVGHGMAASTRKNLLVESSARVSLTPGGTAIVETDMTDIGTGTYTILAQVAGEMLGLDVGQVEVRLGDTDMPSGAGSGGSFGAASSGSSVYLACEALREKLADAMGCRAQDLTLKDGRVIADNRSVPLGDLVGEGLSAEGTIEPGKTMKDHRQAAYGAHFCEVRVNAVTGETRVSRWVSSFGAGRILNEKTARSQCIGGIIFGIGAALTEDLIHDPDNGKLVNRDLAEYHVPVHADVPHIEVRFVEERDRFANPLHAKGIGELGISGAGAAVVNAIHNATGIRIRDYPVTLDKLLGELPQV